MSEKKRTYRQLRTPRSGQRRVLLGIPSIVGAEPDAIRRSGQRIQQTAQAIQVGLGIAAEDVS